MYIISKLIDEFFYINFSFKKFKKTYLNEIYLLVNANIKKTIIKKNKILTNNIVNISYHILKFRLKFFAGLEYCRKSKMLSIKLSL